MTETFTFANDLTETVKKSCTLLLAPAMAVESSRLVSNRASAAESDRQKTCSRSK